MIEGVTWYFRYWCLKAGVLWMQILLLIGYFCNRILHLTKQSLENRIWGLVILGEKKIALCCVLALTFVLLFIFCSKRRVLTFSETAVTPILVGKKMDWLAGVAFTCLTTGNEHFVSFFFSHTNTPTSALTNTSFSGRGRWIEGDGGKAARPTFTTQLFYQIFWKCLLNWWALTSVLRFFLLLVFLLIFHPSSSLLALNVFQWRLLCRK